jgi:hypothetical protein
MPLADNKKIFTINIGDLVVEIPENGDQIYGLITNIDKYLDIEIFWFDIRDFFYYNVKEMETRVMATDTLWKIIRSKND